VPPNGLRLSGDGGAADGVRCSRGLDAPKVDEGKVLGVLTGLHPRLGKGSPELASPAQAASRVRAGRGEQRRKDQQTPSFNCRYGCGPGRRCRG